MTATTTSPPLAGLRAVEVTKHYFGVPAVAGVSVDLRQGQVVGLIGHNGAGKSTLLRILSGAHRHDGGQLLLDGEEVSFSSPADALAHGVATVYQELSLLPNLTVTENVWLGRELSGPRGLRKQLMRTEAADLLERFGIRVEPEALVGTLPVATRQLLEIAIAASKNIRYLLLDEPTTALEGEQVDQLLDYLRGLVRETNLGVLIVDHKLDELYRVADRIVALVDGRVRIDADVRNVPLEDVVHAIVGSDASHVAAADTAGYASGQAGARAASAAPGAVALRVTGVTGPALHGADLISEQGRVVGLYGLIGAGRTELLRTIVGLEPVHGGRLEVFGEPYQPAGPADAMRRGIAYLTEERKTDGIVPRMTSIQNSMLPVVRRYGRAGWLDHRGMRRDAVALLERLRVRGDVDAPIVSLSGGNQQKVLLARVLAQQPRLLLLDEPTKGVDIGVKAEIHEMLRHMARDEGLALIVASSEEEEILEVADAVVVFGGGRTIAGPIPVGELTPARLREIAWSRD